MKFMIKTKNIIIGILLVSMFSFVQSKAQSLTEIIDKNLVKNDITKQLPTLHQLQDLAVEHSPLLKIINSNVVIQQLKIKSEKRAWMQSLGFEAGAKYGLFDNLVLSEDLGYQDLATSTTEQTRYNLGVYLRIPLSLIADNSNVEIAKEEKHKLRYEKASNVKELRQLVIIQYSNVVKAHKAVVMRTTHMQSYQAQMFRADKDYENGLINIAEYVRLQDLALSAQIELENSKIELLTALQLLQETVGVKIKLKS